MFSSVKSTKHATAPPDVTYRKFSLFPHPASPPPKKTVRVFENPPKPTLSKFLSNGTGHSSNTPSATTPRAAVQARFISLQNFAFCAIADPLQGPTAHLGCRFVCTTSGFAQKKDTRPVGGRGISAFYTFFSS